MDQVFREIHAAWLQDSGEKGQGDAAAAGIPTGVETPIAFTPQDISTTIDIGIPTFTLQGIEIPPILRDVVTSPGPFVEDRTATVPSPTLSISSISDLTPTELGEDTEDSSGERMTTHHETFYFEDGNVEVVCGNTLFRVHSTTISFSSPKLREIFSQSALLRMPMPEGCPRVTLTDEAQDFAVLLKMICTPGYASLPLDIVSVD